MDSFVYRRDLQRQGDQEMDSYKFAQTDKLFLNIVLNKSSYIAFNIQYILHIFTNRCAYSWLVLIFFVDT